MYCERHAPIVIANPKYDDKSDQRVTLTIQPEVYGDCRCGDFELRRKEDG